MTDILKKLGQVAAAAATDEDLYEVPADRTALISSLVVCNRGAASSFRAAVVPAGESLDLVHYVAYDMPIDINDAKALRLGITMSTGDKLVVRGTSANFTFSAFGVERS